MVTYILPLRPVVIGRILFYLLFYPTTIFINTYFKPSNFTIFLAGYEERRGNNRHPKKKTVVGGRAHPEKLAKQAGFHQIMSRKSKM